MMALHDYMCPEGHVTSSHKRLTKCHCGKPVEITFEFWDTVHTDTPTLDAKFSSGYYDHNLKAHITDRGQRRRLLKEKGFEELAKSDICHILKDPSPPKENEGKTQKRWERATRFANHRPSPDQRGRALKDLRAGKI